MAGLNAESRRALPIANQSRVAGLQWLDRRPPTRDATVLIEERAIGELVELVADVERDMLGDAP